jgi:hypothetical protein
VRDQHFAGGFGVGGIGVVLQAGRKKRADVDQREQEQHPGNMNRSA